MTEEILEPVPLSCPKCGADIESLKYEGNKLWGCSKCGQANISGITIENETISCEHCFHEISRTTKYKIVKHGNFEPQRYFKAIVAEDKCCKCPATRRFVVGYEPPRYYEDCGCFIATAAFGTPLAQELNVLRNYRDRTLLKTALGKALVKCYYKVSPPLAEIIKTTEAMRKPVRLLIQTILKHLKER